jgi:hypothetical protein
MTDQDGGNLALKERILQNLNKVPANKLYQIDKLVNSLLGAEPEEKDIMRFAGAWKDMSQEWFDSFMEVNQNRRRHDRRNRLDL